MTRIPNYKPVVIISKKSLNGRTFGNTWHFHVPGATTSEARVAYAASVISPMLNTFERNIHGQLVTLIDHYVGDTNEQRPPGMSGESFYERVAYGNVGTQLPGSVIDTYAPLNTALLLKLQVSSERAGFKFIKGILSDGSVMPGSSRGVMLASTSPVSGYNTMLATALSTSGFGNHLFGQPNAGDFVIATAHYAIAQGTTNRYVDHMSYVAGLTFVGATSRQVDRKKVRKTPKDQI